MGAMTGEIPKCLIPLAGRPLLHYQVAALKRGGISEIAVVGGYQAGRLDDALAAGPGMEGVSLIRNPAWESTNMVATLACARDWLEEDFILSYGDIVYRPEYVRALIANREDLAVIVDRKWLDLWSLRFENPYLDAETMAMDPQGRILELGKRIVDPAKVEGQYTGLLKFAGVGRERALARLGELARREGAQPARIQKLYMTDFLQGLIDQGLPVQAVQVDRGWLEMDTGGDYELYHAMAKRGELRQFFDPGAYGWGPA